MDEKFTLAEGRLSDLSNQDLSALLIGVHRSKQEFENSVENLEELKRLAETFGVKKMEVLLIPIKEFHAATFIGSGKVSEISHKCKDLGINLVIFDDEISPQQQRNLEQKMNVPVIDRTELILGVFAQRAQSREAKIQIDLARFQYQLPRLKRMWTHLERQKVGGGSGGGYLKGAGEKQIEIDKRLVNRRISELLKDLEEVKAHRQAQRKARLRANIPTFSIIGYTNAGKSTLLHALTEAKVLMEDKLFATLDTMTKKFILPNRQEILLIDTVGFIQKIPHDLVAAFKSTLEEVLYTDILLHLIDVSHPSCEKQAEATMEVLKELNAQDKPILTVLNKIDQMKDPNIILRLQLKYPKITLISALKKEGFDDLLENMMKEISSLRKRVELKIPQSNYHLVAILQTQAYIISQEYEGNDILISAEIPRPLEKMLLPYLI